MAIEGYELRLPKMLAETFFLEAFIKIQKLGGNNDHEAKSNIMSLFESAYHEFKVSS